MVIVRSVVWNGIKREGIVVARYAEQPLLTVSLKAKFFLLCQKIKSKKLTSQ